AGGSFGYSPTGTPTSLTPLTSSVEPIHATVDGVTWGSGNPAATHFQEAAPSAAVAGSSFAVTVSALTASGSVDAGYAGTVHFTSTDAQAGLPADYTFTPADAGVHTFTVTLKTAGPRTLTATAGGVTGTGGVPVGPA